MSKTLSRKQGSFLFKLTGRKFWEPENLPPPTGEEASEIITQCLKALEGDQKARETATEFIQIWFPDFKASEIRKRFFRKKGEGASSPRAGDGGETVAAEAPKSRHEHEQEQEQEQEESKESKLEKLPCEEAGQTQEEQEKQETDALLMLEKYIAAGMRNIWLHGPAGCGKTTICGLAGKRLGLPVTVLSCSAGTSPGEFLGFRFPSPSPSAITEAIAIPGIIVLDEITMLQPDVAAVANALLANNEVNTVVGHRVRHPDCVIVATANTLGQGADRQYIGNNQLDAATLNRFALGFIRVDYSEKYEGAHYPADVCKFACALRREIAARNFRRIISTRDIAGASKLKAAGLDWRRLMVSGWADDEISAIIHLFKQEA